MNEYTYDRPITVKDIAEQLKLMKQFNNFEDIEALIEDINWMADDLQTEKEEQEGYTISLEKQLRDLGEDPFSL